MTASRLPITGIEPAPEVVAIGDELYQSEEVILEDKRDYDRMRQRYACLQCLVRFDHAKEEGSPCDVGLPDCCFENYRVNEWLAANYRGETWVGPRESYDDELSALAEKNDRKKHRPESSIVLPRGVHLD